MTDTHVTFQPHNMFEPDKRIFTYASMHGFLANPDFQRWLASPTDVLIGIGVEPYGPNGDNIVTGHWMKPDGTHTWWVCGYLTGPGVLHIPAPPCKQFEKGAMKP